MGGQAALCARTQWGWGGVGASRQLWRHFYEATRFWRAVWFVVSAGCGAFGRRSTAATRVARRAVADPRR